MLGGHREHLGHLGGRGRVDDEVGAPGRVEAEVDAVQVALRVAVPDGVGPERLVERPRRLREGGAHALSVSEGTLSAARPNAHRMLSCTTCSAPSPSCASQAARNPW